MEARYHINDDAKKLVESLTESPPVDGQHLPEYRSGSETVYRTRELARRDSTEPHIEQEVIICLVDPETGEDVPETVWTDEQCMAHREHLKELERMAMMPAVFPEFEE